MENNEMKNSCQSYFEKIKNVAKFKMKLKETMNLLNTNLNNNNISTSNENNKNPNSELINNVTNFNFYQFNYVS